MMSEFVIIAFIGLIGILIENKLNKIIKLLEGNNKIEKVDEQG